MPTDQILTVSQFNTTVNQFLKAGLGSVQIRGEVSEFKIAQGKFAYFIIKDNESVLNCFAMAFRLDFPLEDGQEIVVTGTPGIHIKSGRYSLTVDSVTLHGEGALQKAFEELKKKLEAEGLFDPIHKRPLPKFPRRIGVITSDTGAAINDIQKVINDRWGGVTISLIPAKVQGQGAVEDLVFAIETFNKHHPVDVIIFGRGGGSVEDLQAFNAERVARAIFASKIPIISAVGHEHNVSICDLVADKRAATPSNAAELAVPDRRDIMRHIASIKQTLRTIEGQKIQSHRSKIIAHQHALRLFIGQKVNMIRTLIGQFTQSLHTTLKSLKLEKQKINLQTSTLNQIFRTRIYQTHQKLHEYIQLLGALNPQAVLSRGYSITYGATSGNVITSVAQIPSDGKIKTRLKDGEVTSWHKPVPETKKINTPHETRQTTLI